MYPIRVIYTHIVLQQIHIIFYSIFRIGKSWDVLKCIILFRIINITNAEDTPFARYNN